jgi:hypothetical protein
MSTRPSQPTGPLRFAALPFAGLALAVLIAACSAAGAGSGVSAPGTSGAPGAGSPAASATLDPDAIDHPTGARDIVLRVGEEGGFTMMEVVMARLPLFTLYGDGRVLVAQQAEAAKGQAGINGVPQMVLRQAHLDEDQVQAILRNALIDGKVGIAKEEFPITVMDVPTTVIELHAGGVDKRVKVAGLSMDPPPGPDAPVLSALARLVERLQAIPVSEDYVPPAQLAVLQVTELAPGTKAEPWPWTDLAPAAFSQPAPNDPFGYPTHLLTPDQVSALGPDAAPSRTFAGPDGKAYVVVVRPALPEEVAAS